MNKKETAEIKKNFSDKSGFFVMNKVLMGFIDAEKNIRCQKVNSCLAMETEEYEVYSETLKKVLNTSIGKNFCEYEFPNEAYEEGKPQEILYSLLKSELEDNAVCERFLNHIAENIVNDAPYVVITAYCCYTVRRKDKNDENYNGEDEIYRYLLTAFCPVSTGTDGFIFDSSSNDIIKKINTELIINKSPSDGFLYPVFSNRSSDINHVMYYAKSASKPNASIIENVLGCNFVMSAESEKASFQTILKSVVGDDLDYTVIRTINDKLQEVEEQSKDDTDKTVIDDTKLKDILTDIGIPQERISMVEPVFEKVCGSVPLTVSNLIDNKTVLAATGITVNIKPDFADKVRTSVIDGRKCLLIDIDDPTIEINGLPVNLT